MYPLSPCASKPSPLRDDYPAICLEAYWLHNSPEYQTNQLRPAIIVCPGGGYMFLSDREAEPTALRFMAHGYHAFVLRYSAQAAFPAPMFDLANAIALVRRNAAEWFIDPNRIVVCGFSAGGHLAASLGVLWDTPLLAPPLGLSPEQIRPNALLLCYAVIELEVLSHASPPGDEAGQPVYDPQDAIALALGVRPSQALRDQYRLDLHVSPATPPAFIWHTATDQSCRPTTPCASPPPWPPTECPTSCTSSKTAFMAWPWPTRSPRFPANRPSSTPTTKFGLIWRSTG